MTTRHTPPAPVASTGTELPSGPAARPQAPAGLPPASPPEASPTAAATVAGAKTFHAGVNTLMAAFVLCLRKPSADFTRRGKTSARRIAVTAALVEILRAFPSLAAVDPDAVTEEAAAGDALDLIAALLKSLLVEVEDAARLSHAEVWSQLHGVLVAAEHGARTDPRLASRLEPVKAVLAVGKRTNTSAATAAAASRRATQAQTRAAQAQHRATAAGQAHVRVVAAHAANARVRGGVLPAPDPQGPSASAEAQGTNPAPNPQGPASGR